MFSDAKVLWAAAFGRACCFKYDEKIDYRRE